MKLKEEDKAFLFGIGLFFFCLWLAGVAIGNT